MRKLGEILATLMLVIGLAAVGVPANADHGSENYMNALCNSDYSDATIRYYSNYGSGYSGYLGRGECVSRPWNGVDNLRVDVNPYDCLTCTDIDSYKIGEIGVGWGPCHTNSENSSSDPSDHYNDNGTRYRVYESDDCSTT